MGKAHDTAAAPAAQTLEERRLSAFFNLESDMHDLVLMCRISDLLRESEARVDNTGTATMHNAAWDMIEFTGFQCTLRARHLVARWLAAHGGVETPEFGAMPSNPEGGEA